MKEHIKIASYIILFAALALHFSYLRMVDCPEYDKATVQMVADGTAEHPFQHRILVPKIAGWLSERTGKDIKAWCQASEFFCTLAILAAMWGYMGCYTRSHARRLIAVGMSMAWLYVHYIVPRAYGFYFASDVPGVLFFVLGLWCVRRDEWVCLAMVAVAASFNRETILALIPAAVLAGATKSGGGRFSGGVMALIVSIAFVIAKPWIIANTTPGPSFIPCPSVNILAMTNPYALSQMALACCGLIVPVAFGYRWIESHHLRRFLWIVPLWFAGMFLVGNLQEIRIFGELLPVMVPAVVMMDYKGGWWR